MARRSGQRGPEPASVWFDRYALLRLAGEHALTVHECWMLTYLCMVVGWRRHERQWIGHLRELATEARMSRPTADKVITRLDALGLVAIEHPFGRHDDGVIRVLCYPEIVRVKDPAGETSGTPVDTQWHIGGSNVDSSTDTDLHFPEQTPRSQVAKDEGPTRESHNRVGPRPALGAEMVRRGRR